MKDKSCCVCGNSNIVQECHGIQYDYTYPKVKNEFVHYRCSDHLAIVEEHSLYNKAINYAQHS